MRQPRTTQQTDIDHVVHAAVAAAMSDFAALLLAYGRQGPITDDIVAHVQEEVLRTLRNSSATGMSLELQAIAFTRAVDKVSNLMESAITRASGA